MAALTDGNILVGNASNVATSVNPSGDIDISNVGAFSIQDNVVDLATMEHGTAGDIFYYDASGVPTRLNKPGTPAGQVLTYATSATIPSWAAGGTAAHGIGEHTDVARTLFIPVMGAHNVQNFTVVNSSRYHGLRAADGVDCRGTFTSRVPSDFASFTSIKMLWTTPASSGNLVFLCYMHWAAEDEIDNTHAESGDQQTVATGGTEILTYSEMGNFALSGIAVGDIFGSEFRCYRNNGGDTLSNTMDVMGFEFNYVAVQ